MQKDKACVLTPSPALPRKRGREQTESVAGSSPRKRGPMTTASGIWVPAFAGRQYMS
jgi:hypothetical protein